jgi:3-hydroxyacyl-CoA dehydrogenase/enoyl-CoA hydratase/3-hydroxybutyryl-CoA epimerase
MNRVLESRRQIIVNRRPSGVAFMLLDCASKLNYIGSSIMDELNLALDEVEKDKSIKAVVIMSGKHDNFVIGADLYEIRKATTVEELHSLSKRGQHTLNRLAALKIPALMAIHGPALGGGLELAMAGHYRIATDDRQTLLGLPETRLGIIPGIGGTQRLPLLVGLKSALAMILGAEPVSATEALEMGLVDELCSRDELMTRAEQKAVELIADSSALSERLQVWAEAHNQENKPPTIKATKWCMRDLDEARATKLFAMTERSIRIKTKGRYPAQTRVIEVIKTGVFEGITAGLEVEAKAFSELAGSDVAAHLIALFFATDFAKQSAIALSAKLGEQDTSRVGIIGGGMMGASIVALTANHDMDVCVKVNPGKEQATLDSIRALQPRSRAAALAEGSDASIDLIGRHVKCVADYSDLADAQIVLEAVSEEVELKRSVLQELERHVGADCTIASNTSSLPLATISDALQHSDRFVGLHFFHPVERMPLVEIVALKSTSRKAIARAADYVIKLGKIPVMVKDGPGFLINRLLTCYLLETARMVEESVPLNWIEEAAIDFGMPIGPFELLDEVSLSLAVTIASTLHKELGERMAPPEILQTVPKLGLVGKKTGSGMYLWDDTGRPREFNPALFTLPQFRTCPDKSPEDQRKLIAKRLIFPMIDEAARCLEDKIVMKPREIDMAIIHGIGFPPFRGGILKYADRVGLKEVVAHLKELYGDKPDSTRQVSAMLQRYAAEGRGFYSRAGKEEE